MAARTGERRRIADPQAINVRDRGTNVALSDQYRRLGYRFELGPSKIADRVPALGQLIYLRRFKVTTDCPMTAEAIQNYRWEDLTPRAEAAGTEAKPAKKDMDLVDCAQYAASRYIAPPVIKAGPRDPDSPHAKIRAQLQRKREGRSQQNHDLGGTVL